MNNPGVGSPQPWQRPGGVPDRRAVVRAHKTNKRGTSRGWNRRGFQRPRSTRPNLIGRISEDERGLVFRLAVLLLSGWSGGGGLFLTTSQVLFGTPGNPRWRVCEGRGGSRLGDRRIAPWAGLFTAIGVSASRLRLDNSLRFEPIPFKKSISPGHSFRNSPGKGALLLKSPDEIDMGQETLWKKTNLPKRVARK